VHSEYQTYISQVRAALWGENVLWPAEQTSDLLALHAQQGTAALVYPSVLEQDTIPAYARMQMKSLCISAIQNNIPLQHTLRVAWTALEKASIKALLMKGAGLAELYPETHYRTWGDIDIYVGKDQYHPACKVMRDTFPNALKFDEELDHYKHYNIIADGVSIETHRVTVGLQHPLDERRYARMEQYGFEHAQQMDIDGLKLKVFEPTFNALLVFLHSWEHMMTSGANMRQICDLTLLLHHYHNCIDVPLLKRWLRELHLMDVWHLYAYNMSNGLGLPQQEALFYTDKVAQRAEKLMEALLSGRLVETPKQKQVPTGRVARKWYTMRERIGNAKRISIYSPAYARHMVWTTWLHGARRFFAKDRHWE